MLSTVGVSKKFDKGESLFFPDIALENGEHGVLLGQSGTGKTTLLHAIGGLISCESGSIVLNGENLFKMNQTKMDVFRGRHIGLIFQKNYLISALNVYDNIALAQRLAGEKEDAALIKNILEELNIGDKWKSNINTLSHGQAQRVAIARAMINKPQLILADEPTASLDDQHATTVIDMLKSQAKKNNANLIIATHDQRVKEMFSHQIILRSDEHAQA
jgi:putative ABC transport system ATP-binding protein